MDMKLLDAIIRSSLLEFAQFIADKGWRGREREAVSLYVLGFLIAKCSPSGPLTDPTQVGMDVAVRQHDGPSKKRVVCKDLVIWATPAGTCWDESFEPTRNPIAILEWKVRTDTTSDYDADWLKQFSVQVPNFVGYAITFNPSREKTSLAVTRFANGQTEPGWLFFSMHPTDRGGKK